MAVITNVRVNVSPRAFCNPNVSLRKASARTTNITRTILFPTSVVPRKSEGESIKDPNIFPFRVPFFFSNSIRKRSEEIKRN